MGTYDPSLPLDAPLPDLVAATKWYHSFDLPGGVSTPGFYDHRRMAHKLPIPADLSGLRCLDAAAADGFWGFEMAKRGAAEVVSVDLADTTKQDWQGIGHDDDRRRVGAGRARRAFDVVNHVTGLGVVRHDMSIYEISCDSIGRFDFVFLGNVLLHLRDPHRALLALRSVCNGELLSFECISLPLTVLRPFSPCGQLWDLDEPRWWTPNVRAHRRMVEAAGFDVVAHGWPLFQPFGKLIPRRPKALPRRPRDLAYWLFVRQFGVASQWLRCRPRPIRTEAHG